MGVHEEVERGIQRNEKAKKEFLRQRKGVFAFKLLQIREFLYMPDRSGEFISPFDAELEKIGYKKHFDRQLFGMMDEKVSRHLGIPTQKEMGESK